MSRPLRTLSGLWLALAACQSAPPPAPVDPGPPEIRDIAVAATGLPIALCAQWDPSGLEVGATRVTLKRADPEEDGVWQEVRLEAQGDARFASRLYTEIDPGTYVVGIALTDLQGNVIGEGTSLPAQVGEPDQPLRFLDLREDLGLGQPFGLDVLLAYAWPTGPDRENTGSARQGLRRQLENIAPEILEKALGSVYLVDLDLLRMVETSRDLLLERDAALGSTSGGSLGGATGSATGTLPHSLGAQVLAVVELVAPDPDLGGITQLGLRVFDVSYRNYQLNQADYKLWNTRPLIFEDVVELDTQALRDGETIPVLMDGWRELLGEFVRDPYVRSYRAFIAARAGAEFWQAGTQQDLLHLLGVELPDSQTANFAEVEAKLLFLRAESAPAPAGGVVPEKSSPPSESSPPAQEPEPPGAAATPAGAAATHGGSG